METAKTYMFELSPLELSPFGVVAYAVVTNWSCRFSKKYELSLESCCSWSCLSQSGRFTGTQTQTANVQGAWAQPQRQQRCDFQGWTIHRTPPVQRSPPAAGGRDHRQPQPHDSSKAAPWTGRHPQPQPRTVPGRHPGQDATRAYGCATTTTPGQHTG